MMTRLLTVLCPVILAVTAAGCGSTEEQAPRGAQFVTNDCDLIAAIGKERYNFTSNDPPRRLRLNGEDAPWKPNCDWQAMGFNLVEVTGPEGVAATANMAEVSFNRPRYDVEGAQVRTSMTPNGGAAERVLCRLNRGASGGWAVASCGPDPKDVLPRAAAPSPADATPDPRAPTPTDRPDPRDATIPDPNPGGSTPNTP